MIIPAISKDETTPDQFSLKFYLSRAKNQMQLLMNLALTVGVMLGHGEVMQLMVRVPYVGSYFEGLALPVLTALLVGFGAAWAFRWLASKMA